MSLERRKAQDCPLPKYSGRFVGRSHNDRGLQSKFPQNQISRTSRHVARAQKSRQKDATKSAPRPTPHRKESLNVVSSSKTNYGLNRVGYLELHGTSSARALEGNGLPRLAEFEFGRGGLGRLGLLPGCFKLTKLTKYNSIKRKLPAWINREELKARNGFAAVLWAYNDGPATQGRIKSNTPRLWCTVNSVARRRSGVAGKLAISTLTGKISELKLTDRPKGKTKRMLLSGIAREAAEDVEYGWSSHRFIWVMPSLCRAWAWAATKIQAQAETRHSALAQPSQKRHSRILHGYFCFLTNSISASFGAAVAAPTDVGLFASALNSSNA
ncbi:hypothetical protein FB451DRAFT_1182849 [Mycena latifolia]|nr:hypothetical protein FB451DRAFT_1182849 [Mycena latifolia]